MSPWKHLWPLARKIIIIENFIHALKNPQKIRLPREIIWRLMETNKVFQAFSLFFTCFSPCNQCGPSRGAVPVQIRTWDSRRYDAYSEFDICDADLAILQNAVAPDSMAFRLASVFSSDYVSLPLSSLVFVANYVHQAVMFLTFPNSLHSLNSLARLAAPLFQPIRTRVFIPFFSQVTLKIKTECRLDIQIRF